MATFNTPGVYVQEISTLPSSVVAVPTAIPVFIGYTEQAILAGETLIMPTDPIRITSMLEFITIFGGPATEGLEVTLSNPSVDITIADTTTDTVIPTGEDFRMFYNMQMYFANGGGACYVIAVKRYSDGPMPANGSDTVTAIANAEQIDEITMLIAPDALSINVSAAGRRNIYDTMLAHCAKMQDRFSILDVPEDITDTIANDALNFRNSNVGANNLSYGASYYPSYKPAFSFTYVDSAIPVDASAVNLPPSVQDFGVTTLDVINNGVKQALTITITNYGGGTGTLVFNGSITINLGASTTAAQVVTLINGNSQTSAIVSAHDPATNTLTITAVTAGVPFTLTAGGGAAFTPSSPVASLAPDKALYNRIKTVLDAYPIVLYPSSAIAGVYCSVDANRGVWKAPANVSVTLMDSLNRNIKDSDQEGLNVDPTSGKSINAIRAFDGRGIIVWGARTLDGNSNEWRYINVRRTFLFAEDSCKKATEFVVFEPNDKNTWIRVKGMISNFLTSMWRDGALAGDKPEQAFFVRVGLGETMTAQDILEGKMIVQIGLAVVRPAEFIILQFEHKLQEA